jgi:DNA-binding NtrC family response regulator
VRAISQQAYGLMFNYNWPGNVRELQNVIERAVLLCKGNTIEAPSLAFTQAIPATESPTITEMQMPSVEKPVATSPQHPSFDPDEPIFKQMGRMIVSKVPEVKPGSERFDIFDELEGAIVSAALERTKGNKQAAANLLGVYRPRLYHMLRKHKMHQPQNTDQEEAFEPMTAGTKS